MLRAATVTILTLLLALTGHHELADGRPGPGGTFQSSAATNYPGRNLTDFFDQTDAGEAPTCGYGSCPKIDPDKLNVHVVAHTHDDVGWLKTVDQYYYGTSKRYSRLGVEYILDSLIPVLAMDKTKRFVYVEMSFFTKWWKEQDERMKALVKQLVNEGRLEFINGGWCMNDEATVTYHSTIEQMTLGLKFLNETFGACGRPKVGWQIDPFGHSNEQASMFAQFGFDGMYFSRIGFQDKRRRTIDKSLDLIWHGDRALPGQSGSIFTNVFRDHYELEIYCFDVQCEDDPVVDNKDSYEYNVHILAQKMITYVRLYAESKLTNNILIPFGGDFHFSAAGQNFKSFDRLIKYIRANASDINIFYSTPSCYQLAVHDSIQAATNLSLPEKYDDFMPYDSSATIWWSGYFTSRPSTKLIERETAQTLQVARMVSFAGLLESSRARRTSPPNQWIGDVRAHETKCLMPLWEVLGDLQHHDAVTGTEKQHVTDDYQRRVSDAEHMCAKFFTAIRRKQMGEQLMKSSRYEALKLAAAKVELDPIYLDDTSFCRSLNISQCEELESDVDMLKYSHLKVVKLHTSPPSGASNLARSLPNLPLALPKELETKSVLLTVYNPLARPVSQVDIRLPCNGKCDLEKVKVIHLHSNKSHNLIRLPLPAGIARLPYREAHTTQEILFYADVIPALGSASYLISDDNGADLVDEELIDDVLVITDETSRQNRQNVVRGRRLQRHCKKLYDYDDNDDDDDNDYDDDRYQYFILDSATESSKYREPATSRLTRDAGNLSSEPNNPDRVVLKFDMRTGMISGLRRASDGSALNITQKFGQYFAAEMGHPPGAYIFRPNSSEPYLFDKPISFRMHKRRNGGLIEIHQKWADWIWQTIRVDSYKNYIEFDYVIGPIPVRSGGREVVTRYITSMANEGVFFTDSNGRQLLPRRSIRSEEPTQTGGSFYPVVSTLMIRNNRANRSAEAVAVLVDRAQAGTSLNDGNLELLVHRRHFLDDRFGVEEALNEPGEDGRGLVTRGRHRLFLKFPDHPARGQTKVLQQMPKTPRQNLTYEFSRSHEASKDQQEVMPSYLVHDQLFNDIRQESIKYALKPLLTFDRLRITAGEFLQLLHNNNETKMDPTLLNNTMPSNIHLLTLQPWNREANQLLLRFENLDNPVTLHPMPDETVYESLLKSYESTATKSVPDAQPTEACDTRSVGSSELDIEFLLRNIRIISLTELNLGANAKLSEDKRLDWTGEQPGSCETTSGTRIELSPRQIKTFLAKFKHL